LLARPVVLQELLSLPSAGGFAKGRKRECKSSCSSPAFTLHQMLWSLQ
jgi:hypothetical protein